MPAGFEARFAHTAMAARALTLPMIPYILCFHTDIRGITPQHIDYT